MATSIPLENGGFTVVDDCDAEMAASFVWYAYVTNRGKRYANHRVCAGGKRVAVFLHHLILPPVKGMLVDHKDRDTLNNRRSNLRHATHSQNGSNKIPKRVKSPYRGIYQTPAGKWV